ncbi:fungal-specific transcription factor, partial [Thozetella sp. PMI_491]
MTLGRPTCGRWDPSTMNTQLPAPLSSDDQFALSLRASVQFCHICNRIQHRIAQQRRIDAAEAQALDKELVEWHGSLPDVLKNPAFPVARMIVARESLRGRYLNARVILSRCFLLYRTHDVSTGVLDAVAPEEQMISLCQIAAIEAIDTIALNWTPNRVQVWHTSWHLFQA